MYKFTSRFCLWPLLAALVLLSPVSSQSNSRTPSQLYDTPQQPPAAVLPTRLPTPQSRPPTPQFPTVPPIRPTDLSSQNQIVAQRTFPRPIGLPDLPSAPPASSPAQPDRLYTQPDPTGATSSQFGRPGVPSGATFDAPPPSLPPTPTQLYEQPAGSDDREGSIVFPNISLQPTDGLPTPPAPRPPAPTPAGPPSAMMGMPYDFDWDVQDLDSGNIYSHAESSDGTVTRGEYRVLLPDGRLQIVQFVDRGNGYEAKVSYEVYNGQVPQNF